MTYKNAMAGLPLGGGKAVLTIAPQADRRAALHAFGEVVERLNGRYVTAEDVGTSTADMECVAQVTSFVSGLPRRARSGAAGGDPSPWTALGVFLSLRLAVERRLDRDLVGVRVAVQGLGNVGGALCRRLTKAGAKLVVADVDPTRVEAACAELGAMACSWQDIHRADVDVFAPCALGGALDEALVAELKARVVCGGANNQLAESKIGGVLRDRGVLYAPDYVVNAGGIINVAAEWLGEAEAEVDARVRGIPERLGHVLDRADALGISTDVAADQLVEAMLLPKAGLAA
jgi:leucine dehydrogenase